MGAMPHRLDGEGGPPIGEDLHPCDVDQDV
jgi:hypothetical protein